MMNTQRMMLVCQFRGDTARNWGRFGQIGDTFRIEDTHPVFVLGFKRENPQLSGFQNLGVDVQGARLGLEI